MTMANFDIEPQMQMQWWNQYRLAVEEGITYSSQVSIADPHRKGTQE